MFSQMMLSCDSSVKSAFVIIFDSCVSNSDTILFGFPRNIRLTCLNMMCETFGLPTLAFGLPTLSILLSGCKYAAMLTDRCLLPVPLLRLGMDNLNDATHSSGI